MCGGRRSIFWTLSAGSGSRTWRYSIAQQQRTPARAAHSIPPALTLARPAGVQRPLPGGQPVSGLFRKPRELAEWQISPGNSAEQRLPTPAVGPGPRARRISDTAPGSGTQGDHPSGLRVTGSKACTFQSRRTRIQRGSEPDLPSLSGISWFLMKKCRRHVTVGRSKLGSGKKPRRRSTKSENSGYGNATTWCLRSGNSAKRPRRIGRSSITRIALRHVGVNVPADSQRWNRIWPRMLETKLALKVEIYDRDA